MHRVLLHLDGGEVKYSETNSGTNSDFYKIFKRLFTCMNLGSGGATIGLVAEVTGLAGLQVHEVGQNTRQTRQMSGLKK